MRALLAAHGEAPLQPGGEDTAEPYLCHLVHHHRALVTVEAGRVVAFGAAVDTGRCRMLSDLFVRPDRLGQGIGRTLLAALLGDGERLATFSSADPRALPSYVRAGMTPRWVNLYLQGLPQRLPDPGPAVTVRSAVPAELAALESRWLGAPRTADHAFWATLPGADPFLVEDRGRPVAFGYGRARSSSPARALDRLVVAPAVDPVAPSVAGLIRAGRGSGVQLCVPGPHPLLPVLLEAGFRIVDQDQFLASHPDIVDPAHLLPNPGLL